MQRRPCNNQHSADNGQTKCPRFGKIKRGVCQRTSQRKTPHLILPQPHGQNAFLTAEHNRHKNKKVNLHSNKN